MVRQNNKTGKMTVGEAGERGGEATSKTHGREFYQEIGHKGGIKGGPKVRDLIKKGEERDRSR